MAERDLLVDELTALDAELRHVYSRINYFISSNEIYLRGKDPDPDNLRPYGQNEVMPPAF